jgi:hypothetical protein
MKDETAQKNAPERAGARGDPAQAQTDAQADLQAEQESAAAMNADVPQPPDEAQADEGPSA